MLDLSKSYGRYEGVSFFGDHQDDNIVYYLPDHVELARKAGTEDEYEFFMQLFHDNKMEDASIDDLEDTAGSILQLSVNCMVAPEKLEAAFAELKRNVTTISSEATCTTPLWTDGSVDLITLDETSFDDKNNSDMVKAIVSTQRPSFTQDLKSIFNVRYDRRGTELIYSAIKNRQSVVAAVYDLQFAAIQPAVDLKITAFLKRCQETARKNLDADFRLPIEGVQLDLGAHLEWLTRNMEENGDIKIELTTNLTTDEEKKQVDDMVNEFRDMVLHELFSPILAGNEGSSLLAETLSKALDAINPVKIGLSYKLKEQTISEDRIISVDYSERSAVIKHHNPQTLISDNMGAIGEHLDDYVKKVVIGNLWMTQSVDIKLLHDFEKEDNDLDTVEILIWKHKDGLMKNAQENCFAIPANIKPLGNFIFNPHEGEQEHNVSWLCGDDDDGGYYYQMRFIYTNRLENMYSPKEIVTPPLMSFNRTIIIAPDSYMFFKNIPVITGSLDFNVFEKVEVIFNVNDAEGMQLASNERILLSENANESRFIVRGKDQNKLDVWVSKIFYFKDKTRPPLKYPCTLLQDYAVIIDNPLISKELYLIISGEQERLERLIFTYTVTSPVTDHPVAKTQILRRSDEVPIDETPINIVLYTPEDTVSYEITKYIQDADGKRQIQKLDAVETVASQLSLIHID